VVVTVEFDNIEAEIVLESLREYRKLHECCLAAETGGCWAAETGESARQKIREAVAGATVASFVVTPVGEKAMEEVA